MLVATAGHVDHGKTALVRALTEIDTDRLPEEKARGISIDLGFAYWQTPDSGIIGFVDVPGHERFVRNMLAGVSAVHFALLIVAADDGVMPQSVEHAQILDLLGIKRGIVVLTKCDRVSRDRIEDVRRQVEALLAGTTLDGSPVFEVSSITGAGIAELGDALRAASPTQPLITEDGRNFRLAIDRAFAVTGVGTVVTGTVVDGEVKIGERLVLSPSGIEVRVRGAQSAGKPTERIAAGQRAALNLAGAQVGDIRRGDWLLIPSMHAPSARMDVDLRLLGSEGKALRHYAPVQLHLGTAKIGARVLLPGQASVAPRGKAIAQLVLESPSCAANADRFVIRDVSGSRTIGGGRVIDPLASDSRRTRRERAPLVDAFRHQDPADALCALLALPGHEVDRLHFERCYNLAQGHAQQLYRASGAVLLGRGHILALPADRLAAASEEIVNILRDFHREEPEVGGVQSARLHARLSGALSETAFQWVLRDLAEKRLIEMDAGLARLPGHASAFSPADMEMWRRLLPWLKERGLQPFTADELERELRLSPGAIQAMLYRRRKASEVCRITSERYLLREQVVALADRAAALSRELGSIGFTAAQYRDAIGTGRALAIQILEYLDSIGVTARQEDRRRVHADYERFTGSAKPDKPAA